MPQQRSSYVYVFDVNETLLDLSSLDQSFLRAFGDSGVRRQWFQQVLQSALVSTVIDDYADFTKVQYAAVDMVAQRLGVDVSAADRDAIVDGMKSPPPHPDVPAALARLHGAGLRLATLTNSPAAVAKAQIENADLGNYFEQLISADSVRRLKPAPEPYRMAAQRLGVDVAEIRLIAAHAWDIAGALHAGCAAAFVARPGAVLDPLFPKPDIVGKDLGEVVDRILEL